LCPVTENIQPIAGQPNNDTTIYVPGQVKNKNNLAKKVFMASFTFLLMFNFCAEIHSVNVNLLHPIAQSFNESLKQFVFDKVGQLASSNTYYSCSNFPLPYFNLFTMLK
jgi:hypothetical protein